MNYLILVLTVLASYGLVLLTKPRKQTNIKLLLAFSGAFLLALTFFELVPEVYSKGNPKTNTLFILIGVLLQLFLEFFSKGAEHGHMHWQLDKNQFPTILFISLSLHALIEGIPISGENGILYGILVHKIPVAIILSMFLVNSKLNRGLTIIFILLFALMTPLGSYLASETTFISTYKTQMVALVVGVFLHISTVILFESAKGHSFDLKKLIVVILGFGIAYFL
ncbi:ZIP family metal transporter [Muricauda sp. SCSIO 64092]|uniref:ZIP family metal transporter n=1 Tax=Allomuricauda sp. SCSIO 64092 TaxID=2908842 RepID=UPI001FF63EE1|nr:ZIP family metal transporter [Muricauda sp. SCSIO 64092]UOY06029.1 ZIP family metal transporter [Muricauda sp. SCSIO 64092]